MVIEITTLEQFDEILKDSSTFSKHGKKYILVDFYATWCRPCMLFTPVLEQFSQTYGDNIYFVKVDIDKVSDLAERYVIKTLPTFMLFDSGTTESTYEPLAGANKEKMEARLRYLNSSDSKKLVSNEESLDF